MARLPRVSGRDVLGALLRAGFTLSHVNGSHHFLRHASGRVVIVPVHRRQTMPSGTLRSVLRQAGLSSDEFVALLQ